MVEEIPKEEQRILVVLKKKLFGPNGERHFQGFRKLGEVDYETLILEGKEIMRRGSDKEPIDHPEGNAERSLDYKQPIGYMIVANTKTEKIFAYQRSSNDAHYRESRLQGKWSWGIGGHIEPQDGESNPIRESRLRELAEEIEIDGKILETKVLGYINDEADDVGNVHFGVLYLVEIDGSVKPKPTSKEMAFGNMLSISELNELVASVNYEVENWSAIALEPLRKYFEQL